MLNIQGLRPQSRHEFYCELHNEYQGAQQLQQRMLNYQSQEVNPVYRALDKAKALDIAIECDRQMENIIKQLNRVFAN